ncbi:MAG TPA: S4 domain-containing protein [Croceibacterium sp.]
MRLDRLLFTLRFSKSRTLAQRWIAEGHIRRNGERVMRQDLAVAVGDVLTLPLAREVLVIELLDLPARRGPASEARACYRRLDAGGAKRIAGGEAPAAQREAKGEAQQ